MAQQRIDMLGDNTGVGEELFKTVRCREKLKMKEKEPEEEDIPIQMLEFERQSRAGSACPWHCCHHSPTMSRAAAQATTGTS